MLNLSQAVVLLVLSSSGTGQVPASIGEIEAKVLANRREIVSGQVVLESKVRAGKFSAEYAWTVYFADKKMRQDEKRQYNVVPKDAVHSYYIETTCFADDVISYSDQVMPDGGTMVLAIRNPKKMKVEAAFEVVEPRILGMTPLNFPLASRMFRLDSFIGSPNRKNVSLSRDVKDGINCYKIEFKPPGFRMARAWVAPALGYNVVRMELEFKGDGSHYVDSVDLEIKKHEKSGVWFPVSQHYQRVEDDNRVTEEEHLKVTVISLNEPLDPTVFMPAGMNVRPGTPVVYLPERGTGQHVWDGDKIVSLAVPEKTLLLLVATLQD